MSLPTPSCATSPTSPLAPALPPDDDACPVVALHCSGGGSSQWKGWRSDAHADLEVVAPSLLGYSSPQHWDLEHRVDLLAEGRALRPVLDRYPGGVHLIGHSYGGAVALELALRHPDRIRSLALYEPVRFSLLREFGDPEWDEIVGVAQQMVKFALTGSLDAPSQYFVDYWSGVGTWARLPAPVRETMRLRLTKVCAEFDALFSDRTPLSDYRRLPMPIRLLSGTLSPAPALRVIDRLAELLPGAQRVRLVGLGHMGPVQDPARVMEAAGLLA